MDSYRYDRGVYLNDDRVDYHTNPYAPVPRKEHDQRWISKDEYSTRYDKTVYPYANIGLTNEQAYDVNMMKKNYMDGLWRPKARENFATSIEVTPQFVFLIVLLVVLYLVYSVKKNTNAIEELIRVLRSSQPNLSV